MKFGNLFIIIQLALQLFSLDAGDIVRDITVLSSFTNYFFWLFFSEFLVMVRKSSL
jgi:hypothetical protein